MTTCPHCHEPLLRAQQTACGKCGFSFAGGFVQRAKPEQTRGITGIAHKFGFTKSLLAAALMFGLMLMYYFDITDAEANGGSITMDPLSGLVYQLAGKWVSLIPLFLFGIVFLRAAARAKELESGRA